jgi:hypothetical protein
VVTCSENAVKHKVLLGVFVIIKVAVEAVYSYQMAGIVQSL